MKMQSITINVPARIFGGVDGRHADLKRILCAVLRDGLWFDSVTRAQAVVLSKAVADAPLDEYNDGREMETDTPTCGPVFYIP